MNEPDAARAAAPEVDEARAARVRRVSAQWQRELVDLSGRNRLLYYRDQKLGTIDLGAAQAPADPIAVDQLLDGRPVALSQLFRPTEPAPAPDADDDRRTAGPATDPGADPGTDPDRGRAALARQARRARTIAAKADEMFEERGIRTLFLGVGMARWTEQQSAAQPAAPVVLFPLAMRPRGASAEDFELAVIGDPGVSATLLEKLATDFGLRAPVAELDDLLLAGDGADDGADGGLVGGWPIADVFDRLIKEAGGHVPGFAIGQPPTSPPSAPSSAPSSAPLSAPLSPARRRSSSSATGARRPKSVASFSSSVALTPGSPITASSKSSALAPRGRITIGNSTTGAAGWAADCCSVQRAMPTPRNSVRMPRSSNISSALACLLYTSPSPR